MAGRRSGVGLGLDRLGRLLPAGGGRPADLARAEKLLRRGYRVPGVRDRVYIAERLQEVCEDSGRPDEARQFGEQAERLRHEPLRAAARPVPPPGNPVPPRGREHRAKGQGGPQCPVPLRQREEVQEVLRFPAEARWSDRALRLPADVIDELRQQARTRHVRYTTYVRSILERAAPPELAEITERLDRIERALTDRHPQDDQKTA